MYNIILGRTIKHREKYGLAGTIFLGRHYIKMGQYKSLASNIHMDVSGPHVVLVCGKRGSGKSYTLGVMAEGLVGLKDEVSKNLSALIFDTMGIFWTMKYPNYRDDASLKTWGLAPTRMQPVVFVPAGLYHEYEEKEMPVDKPFSIKPLDVGAERWTSLFDIKPTSEEALLLDRLLDIFEDYEIDDLINEIPKDTKATEHTKVLLTSLLENAKNWGIFSKNGTELGELFVGGQATVIDLSIYGQMEHGLRIKQLIVGLVCERLLQERLMARKEEEIDLIQDGAYLTETEIFAGKKAPLVWVLIDEAHNFIPNTGKTLASEPLIRILREGRQPGLTLILATQQPGAIAIDALTQSDIVISHRLTAKADIDALSHVMQTYLPQALQQYIRELPATKGSAVILDDKLERIYPAQIRPRTSWHGGADPTAITKEAMHKLAKSSEKQE
jgi:hypothetical protein